MKDYNTPSVYLVGPASQTIQISSNNGSDGDPFPSLGVELSSKLEEE